MSEKGIARNDEVEILDVSPNTETGTLLPQWRNLSNEGRMTRPRDTRTGAGVTPRANRLGIIATENCRKTTRRLPITKSEATLTQTQLITDRRRLDHRHMVPETVTSPVQFKPSRGSKTSHREKAPTMTKATTDRPKKNHRCATRMEVTASMEVKASHLVLKERIANIRRQSMKENMMSRLVTEETTETRQLRPTDSQDVGNRGGLTSRRKTGGRIIVRATPSVLVLERVITGLPETWSGVFMMSRPAKYREIEGVDSDPNPNTNPVAARETLRRLPTNTKVSPILCRGIWSCAGVETKVQSGLAGVRPVKIAMRIQERSCTRTVASSIMA